MFDWLFGKSKEAHQKEQQQALDKASDAKFINDYVASEMSKRRDQYGNVDAEQWGTLMDRLNGAAQKSEEGYMSAQKKYDTTMRQQRHNYVGDGLLGSIVNPVIQTGTAVADLATGNYKGRDVTSDLGAAGSTLLGLIPGAGTVAGALKLGKVASGLGKASAAMNTIPGGIASGAVLGALDGLRQNGEDTNVEQLAQSAGMGAALGGAVPAVGKVLRNRGAKNMVEKYMSDPRYADVSEAMSRAGGDVVNNMIKGVADTRAEGLKSLYGNIYRNALPQSKIGKLALGGGALYGGAQMLGLGGGEQEQPQTPQTLEDYYKMQRGGMF